MTKVHAVGVEEVTGAMSISSVMDAIAIHPNHWNHHRIKDKRYVTREYPRCLWVFVGQARKIVIAARPILGRRGSSDEYHSRCEPRTVKVQTIKPRKRAVKK